MDDKQETIADIVAEMRNTCHNHICPYWEDGGGCDSCPIGGAGKNCIFDNIADRIEAAHKREIEEIESDGIAKGINSMSEVCLKHGYFDDKHIVNGAKMREVVELLARVILPLQEEYPAEYGGGKVPDKDGWLAWIRQMQVRACVALATPPRNCDVGTADDQYRRHDAFCNATRKGMSGYHCKDTPRCVFCFSKWAQMPYEEGGAK